MAGKKTSPPEDDESSAGIELTEDEIELICRVLSRHRMTLPTYLLSMQEEIGLIDSILEKLSDIE